jgi:hypothetical protein
MSQDNKYHLGLCMAGAVSAGAYTAGVMDCLIEAIDKWEKAKGMDESIPTHQIQIDVIGGASAGGMTSIITAIALQKKFDAILKLPSDGGTKNPFFDSWVNLASKNMMQLMLENADLEKMKSVKSIFNSSFIDTIANRTISSFTPGEAGRDYIRKDLDVFVTLSNLIGVPYNVRFRGNGDKASSYKMASFRDVGHFSFCGGYANNGKINITGEDDDNMKILRDCAMATGAFPFGLQYREVHRHIKYLKENKDLQEFIGNGDVDWKKLEQYCGPDKIYRTVNADGGLMNNEPFEITLNLLCKKSGSDMKTLSDYAKTNGSVLMIDPFPTEEINMEFTNDFGLGSLAGKIFGAMRGQLTFKEEDIEMAMDPMNASRYMIVPKRNRGNDEYAEGAKAIACGALGGFSGFFDYHFRTHDYFLGRYNAQKFLRDVYTIQDPLENPIFKKGYHNLAAQERFFMTDKATGKIHAPIIPDVDWDKRYDKIPEKYYLPWPQYDEQLRRELPNLFRKRYKAVFKKSVGGNWLNKLLMGIGYQVVIGRVVTGKTISKIEEELKEHGLMK